jgi:NAD(P)-dependent dehydrogenase (short-subunit alcohol dehydrogenase family)
MDVQFDFSGKTAVVSGGASGIGRAVATGLLDAGARVAVLDINEKGLAALVSSRPADGERLFTIPCDIGDAGRSKIAVDFVAERFGAPHFLVNSAAVNIRKPAFDLSDEELEGLYGINVFGVLRLCRLFGRFMAEADKGDPGDIRKIVNIASTGAWQGSKNYFGYNSSKAALVNGSRVLANEWYQHGIIVNTLCPGPTMTPFLEPYYRENPELKEAVIRRTPAGRIAEAEDHVGPVLFLLSRASDWIVGEVIASDGGKGLNS